MQDLALAEGALPKHLHTSMFTQSSDNRMLTNRQLSRHLVGLWVTGHPTAMGLLRRLVVSIDCCWGAGAGLINLTCPILMSGFGCRTSWNQIQTSQGMKIGKCWHVLHFLLFLSCPIMSRMKREFAFFSCPALPPRSLHWLFCIQDQGTLIVKISFHWAGKKQQEKID